MTKKTKAFRGLKADIFILALLLWASALLSQDIIENPDRPLNPKAGRILQLKEELRITDEGGEFFLKYPRIVKVAPDGSFFILDFENLIHLDPQGRYLGNFFKKGQGPGELNYVSNFDFASNYIIVNSSSPEKIVWFDFKRNVVREISLLKIPNRLSFVFYGDGAYYVFKYGAAEPSEKPEVIDIPQVLMAISEDGKEIREFMSFPNKSWKWGGAIVLQELLFVPHLKQYLFVSHTRDYSVKVFDIQSQKLLRTVNRKYERVKRPKDYRGAAIIVGDKRYEAPGSEYLPDLKALFIFKDTLWAVTSTKEEKKGVLVDVYNLQGTYIDAFFLGLNGSIVNTYQDSILVREERSDELIQIVKYKVAE